jgi:RHS repeat-associated protein
MKFPAFVLSVLLAMEMTQASAAYFDAETGMLENGHRNLSAPLGRYIQPDPSGLPGGMNLFLYVGGNPFRFIDPLGLTPIDIDNAFTTAKMMMPGAKYPSGVRTWTDPGKMGKSHYLGGDIYVDSKYLECLDDGEATALLMTILHEIGHFNQAWYQFAADNVRERVTRGNSSSAQSTAEQAAFNHSSLVAQYLKNRHVSNESCQCRK